jgi:tetratricopeptide (TPR) repeat protein
VTDDREDLASGQASLAPQSPTASGGPSVAELSARADALLAAGELGSYGALFTQAAAEEDENRRYRARKTLLERGLAATGQAPDARCLEIYLAVAEAAVAILELDPAEPVLLNYAGVALYELWSLDAARALFLAAQRLDPELPYLHRNLTSIAARKRSAGRPRRPLHRALPQLARRATAIAPRARPVAGLTLSLCMIVRDEAEMLPRCLAAVAGAVDEIVVVDTGSCDGTIEIARSFGARVIEREWTGSFAEARNVSFDAATGDWVMYLDADEILVGDDVERLRALTGRTWREAFYLTETNFTGGEGDGTGIAHNALRVFRNRPHYRFEGRLHEQIAHHLPAELPERVEHTAVRIEHYGYLGSVRDAKEKSRRNIDLLRAQQAEGPATPFLHFNLGSEHAAAGDQHAALREFERAWAMLQNEGDAGAHEFTPSLVARLVKSQRMCGRDEAAIAQAQAGLELFPGFTDLVFERAMALTTLNREAEAVALYERCMEMGDAPSRYGATIGCGTYLPRLALAALHLHHGELAPARALLDWCLEKHPGFYGSVHPYATALLRAGWEPEAVAAEIERRVTRATPTVHFALGQALYEAGAVAAAERQFRLVLAAQPDHAQARVSLAEAVLHQHRYLHAAAEAALMSADDPLAPLAARTELIGRIAGGDTDGAREAAAGALGVGLPAVERELFEAWIAIGAGGPVPRGLSAAATPLLFVILELMLRLHDFQAFEALHPLLEHSGLARREQRELLACIYLRRGFLKSAAEEWMAVCSERPDPRGLIGLARVAAAQGLPEEAANFAAQARALDPGSAAARALIRQAPPVAAA